MKRIKFLLALLMVMLGTAVQAQQVVINKSDGSVEVFQPNEVDSVVYKPAPKYYYYAGWECPRNEAELARLAVEPNGGKFTSLTGLDTNKDYYPNTIEGPYDYWYIIIPNTLNAYDAASGAVMTNSIGFIKETSQPIQNHTIWKSSDRNKTDEFAGIKIY